MALPIVDNQSTDATQQAIDSLGQIIKEKVNASISGGVKTIIPNIPKMINELTVDLKKGPVNSFTRVIVKLERLVEKLGLDLREYSTELADLMQKREEKAVKSEATVQKLREQGVVARINETTKEVKILSKHEIRQEEKAIKLREKAIIKLETKLKRDAHKLQTRTFGKDENQAKTKKDLQKNSIELARLKELQEKKKKGISTDNITAHTGSQSKPLPMFLENLKMTFMEPFQAMGAAFGQLKEQGKGAVDLVDFLTGGMLLKSFKALGKGIKAISGFFSIARLVLIAKFALVIGAIIFVAKKIKAITGFFKKIIEWFKNSWLGKKLGLADNSEAEEAAEKVRKAKKEEFFKEYEGHPNPKMAYIQYHKWLAEEKKKAEAPTEDVPVISESIKSGDASSKGLEMRGHKEHKYNEEYYKNLKAQNEAVEEFTKLNLASKKGLNARGINSNIYQSIDGSTHKAIGANVSVQDSSKDKSIIDTSDSRWTD